jgi:hypothetical protein
VDVAVFVAVVALAIVFALGVMVVTLRFTAVISDMRAQDSRDRVDIMAKLDASHVHAFTNAMTALKTDNDRVVGHQNELLKQTLDMIVGPQVQTSETSVENINLDLRADWQSGDDEDVRYLIDPTDMDVQLGIGQQYPSEPHASMVRPGQSLVPGQ